MTDSTQPGVPTHHNAPECTNADNRLNEKQLVAIEMLILGKSVSSTARDLQIDRSTLFRWRQEAHFSEYLTQRRQQVWNEANDRLRAMVNRSLDVMEEHLADRYDRARFRAASVILRVAQLRKAAAVE